MAILEVLFSLQSKMVNKESHEDDLPQPFKMMVFDQQLNNVV